MVKSTAWWFQPIPCEATGLFSRDAPHRKEGNWLTFLWERINLPPQNGKFPPDQCHEIPDFSWLWYPSVSPIDPISGYPTWLCQAIAIEHGPVEIVSFPIEKGDFQ